MIHLQPPPPLRALRAPQAGLGPELAAAIASSRKKPCAHRILCGPVRLWPRSRSARILIGSQALEVGMSAVAISQLRPMRLHFVVPSPAIAKQFFLAPLGPNIGPEKPAPVGSDIIGIAATDFVDTAIARMLRIPPRAQRAANIARAIAALDAGIVRLHRAALAEGALRAAASACAAAIASAASAGRTIVYSPQQGPGDFLGGPSPDISWLWLGLPGCSASPMMQTYHGAQSEHIGNAATYRGLGIPIAMGSLGIDGASKMIPITVRAAKYLDGHILPRSRSDRQAFLFNVGAALVDGLVTNAGLRAGGRTEADPIVRPFAHGNFVELMGGWAMEDFIATALTKKWSPDARADLNRWAALQHIIGAFSWSRQSWPKYLYPIVIDGMGLPASPQNPLIAPYNK